MSNYNLKMENNLINDIIIMFFELIITFIIEHFILILMMFKD